MNETTRRSVKEGIGFGIIAGLFFALMEILGAAMMGNPPLMPLRMFASVVLGSHALDPALTSLGGAFAAGIVVHLVLSALFGLVYGLASSRLRSERQTSWGVQAAAGFGFGAAVWLLNCQIIARALYPWFLEAPQLLQLVMHALFFGLPLGLLYAASERKAHQVSRAAT
jgi:hypothetical protein